jgi:hypothetical protein
MEGARKWLIGVAGGVAAVMVVESVGLIAAAGLGAVSAAVFLGYRFYRSRNPAKGPAVYCLRCGETLLRTARQCKYCGSASWTMRQ